MPNHFFSILLVAVFVFLGVGCGKAGTKESPVQQNPLALKLDFTQAESPDLLAQNQMTELQAPPFDSEQQAALVAEVNAVWAQCGISFEAAGTTRALPLRTWAELRPESSDFDGNRGKIAQRIGRDTSAASRKTQEALDSLSDFETQGVHLARNISATPHTIPVLILPHTGSVFPGSSFGQTFGIVDDGFLRSLLDGTYKTDSNARQLSKPLVINYGYEMNYRHLMTKPDESFACSQNRGPGKYFNVLAHEIGHFLGLNHTLPKCNLMHNDSNLITPAQCATARKAAEAL